MPIKVNQADFQALPTSNPKKKVHGPTRNRDGTGQ